MAVKRRSGEAQAALGRKAGPMKHRNTPRGGAKNDQADMLEEYGMEDKECKLPPQGWWCSREAGHDGPCAARQNGCMHWSIGDPEGSEDHFVSPFDPPSKIMCQCPGNCPGYLVIDGTNVSNTLTFLVCTSCGCAYEAPHVKKI